MLWRRCVLFKVSFSVPKYLLVSLLSSAKVHESGESVSSLLLALRSVSSLAAKALEPNVKYWLSFVGVGGVSCASSEIYFKNV